MSGRTESGHTVAIIGAGPAGLMAAERLSAAGCAVTVYDRMPSAGRKLLMAGRGGLNLTHSEALPAFLARYDQAAPFLSPAIDSFSPADLRGWADALGQDTFVGSSGRVFPRSLKTSPLLRAWLSRLIEQGVEFRFRNDWLGWDNAGNLSFDGLDGAERAAADATVLALGGASWPRLGANGSWTTILAAHGIDVSPLRPANCGFCVSWSEVFRARFEGQPVKNVAVRFDGRVARGDFIITSYGIEGGAIYALSASLREAIAASGEVIVTIDLRPDLAESALADRLRAVRTRESASNLLRKAASLPPVAIGLLREAVGVVLPRDALGLAALIKSVPLRPLAPQPLDRAISTAGGIALHGIDRHFMLRAKPGVFVAGEMLDWEAPTGGYLLQACFATGMAAANGALDWLGGRGGGG